MDVKTPELAIPNDRKLTMPASEFEMYINRAFAFGASEVLGQRLAPKGRLFWFLIGAATAAVVLFGLKGW